VTRRTENQSGTIPGTTNAEFTIPALDELLRGMYWGENFCWRITDDAAAGSEFCAALVATLMDSSSFDQVYTIGGSSRLLTGTEIHHIDPAETSAPAQLRRAIATGHAPLVVVHLDQLRENHPPRQLESLVAEIAQASLLTGFIAHWFGSAADELSGIESLAQCVIDVQAATLRVTRADGRSTHTRGALLPYQIADGRLVVEPPSVTALLGRGLRAVRRERGWSQSQLGDLIGISGSAISQAERGQHALSLESMVELTDKLGLSIDQLLRGRPPAYQLARATGPGHLSMGSSRLLIDDPAQHLRTALTRIDPRGTVSPGTDPSSPQLLLIGQGLVQIVLTSDRPILRQGDALLVQSGGILSCRNLGDHEALVFIQEHS
jgi:transcriptional regulator with XRE-family HTH domain